MNHDEVYSDTWRDQKDEWVDYIKNDIICSAFSYARYSKAMEEITGFGMKDCLSFPGLGWKHFNSLRSDENEPTYTDYYKRYFVRQRIKSGRVCSFNQFHKSKLCDVILKKIPEELNVTGKLYDIIETYINYKISLLKSLKRNIKVNLTIIEMRI